MTSVNIQGERLTSEAYANLFDRFEWTAFRLETQPTYRVPYEADAYSDWLAGTPALPDEIPWFRAWLDQIRAAHASGRRVQRVRVVDNPPTDYQRWELWATPYAEAAGEDIRLITRARLTELGIPGGDWWLFDNSALAKMAFDDEGRPQPGVIVTDPEVIAQHVVWRDLARTHSTALIDWTE